MISLALNKTVDIPFMGTTVKVAYRVPTAAETEEKLRKDIKDTDVFRAFVTSVASPDIEGWTGGVDAETVIAAPGTYKLVSEAALEVVKSAFLLPDEKN